MKTVTINFAGGAPYSFSMPTEAADDLIKAFMADPNGVTHITSDEGLSCVCGRMVL